MATVKRFEDLIAWQRARELTRDIYQASASGSFAKDFGLRDQIQRACVSVMSNIAEGFDRGSRAEFHHFLSIAKGSCAEVLSQLYVATDLGYMDTTTFGRLKGQTEELARIVGGLRVKVGEMRGTKRRAGQ